jgi:hypothetical protein
LVETLYKNTNHEKNKSKSKAKKNAQIMYEFKHGELHAGQSDVFVSNPKKAIAMALSEAEGLE